ncbi:MAG: hypothetical protein KAX40_08530 [Herpetosiphon sp.]|nr:hypothetical protein [Herpetosiphon sp.]
MTNLRARLTVLLAMFALIVCLSVVAYLPHQTSVAWQWGDVESHSPMISWQWGDVESVHMKG